MSTATPPSQGPISTPVGSSPQSTPVSTSPRKFLMNKNLHKRAVSDQGSIPSGEKSAQRKVSDGTSPQATSESKQESTSSTSEKLGQFHTIPHMMKLYETAKGAFKTYQVNCNNLKNVSLIICFDFDWILSDLIILYTKENFIIGIFVKIPLYF